MTRSSDSAAGRPPSFDCASKTTGSFTIVIDNRVEVVQILHKSETEAFYLKGDKMKILTTYEAKNAFPKVLKLSQKDVVIVTNRGKPVAAIQGLKDENDLEDYLLERSPKFWAVIRRARRGKSVALDEVKRQLGLSRKGGPRAALD
jgi:prevent-host-death family protein